MDACFRRFIPITGRCLVCILYYFYYVTFLHDHIRVFSCSNNSRSDWVTLMFVFMTSPSGCVI